LVRGIPAQINLIPLNATAEFAGAAASRDAALRFRTVLRDYGLPVSVRQRRGVDIAAGCGQLAGDDAATNAELAARR
jgi:23S rRNA (adenine2503-C2)-methyltransferase